MWNIFLLSWLVGISNSAPAGWWASDITYSLNVLKSMANYENQKEAILVNVNDQLINYKNYNNGQIESAIQIEFDPFFNNEITEIRYLLGSGLFKIYLGEKLEKMDFNSEFGAEVAYSCQEKSNISAANDQINLGELENIFENIDFVFNTQHFENSNDQVDISKGRVISDGKFNLVFEFAKSVLPNSFFS
jgi:hypothetical protein